MAEKRIRKRERAGLNHETSKALIADRVKQSVTSNIGQSMVHRDNYSLGVQLTPAQSRMWYAWLLEPNDPGYNLAGSLYFKGKLEANFVKQCFTSLILRHGGLRLVFDDQQDSVFQHCDVDSTLEFEVIRAANSQRDNVERFIKRPFNLRSGPLLRVLLHDTIEGCELVVVMHHIITDGTSMQLMLSEFVYDYQQLCAGRILQKKHDNIDFVDYALWFQKQDFSKLYQHQLSQWHTHLGCDFSPLTLPALNSARRAEPYDISHYQVNLDSQAWQKIQQFSTQLNTTAYVIVLGVFNWILYRYSGQNDIKVGIPVANRHQIETSGIIGFFVNTLVMRTTLSHSMTLRDVCLLVKQHHGFAQGNQDLPFEKLVDSLATTRYAGVHPLFQVMFNYLKRDKKPFTQLNNVELIGNHAHRFTMPFDLQLEVIESNTDVTQLHLYYATQLYNDDFAVQFLTDFEYITSHIDSLAAEPLHQLSSCFQESNLDIVRLGLGRQYRREFKAVHQDFSNIARAQPAAIALSDVQGILTYSELEMYSNQLAHKFIAQGIKPEDRVGVCLARDTQLLVSLLAILKAGAAYVPLDISWPVERIAQVVTESGMTLLLGNVAETLNIPQQLPVFSDYQHLPTSLPDIKIVPQQLAYVIFTSGSTGRPKGVAVTHGNLANFILAMQHQFTMGRSDSLLAMTSLAFDISGLELFLPLLSGSRVKLLGSVIDATADDLAGVTHIQATPAGWRSLLSQELLTSSSLAGDPLVGLCGGEALSTVLAQQLDAVGVSLWNMYGPTETTVWSSMCQVNAGMIHLGQAINNTQLYVLDNELNQCPRFSQGELYIAGDGVAQGYLGQPALTAERFIANPFNDSGERLYRTGDVVRWNERDQLEYLGRSDHQVKVRGFRIELGDIEAQLQQLESVNAAVVIVTQRSEFITELVAYVESTECSEAQLKSALAQQLPDYMVPQRIVLLDTLPLNVNGKIDRHKLPDVECGGEKQHMVPQGELEQQIAGIWQQVLDIETVSRDDQFFALGGDSILALKAMTALNKTLHKQYPLRLIFDSPQLLTLAEALRSYTQLTSIVLFAEEPDEHFLASSAQRSIWIAQQLNKHQAQGSSYNIVGGMDICGPLDTAAMRSALQQLGARHQSLHMQFFEQDDQVYSRLNTQYQLTLEYLDVSVDPNFAKQIAHVQHNFANFEFDLSQAPLTRVLLIKRDAQKYRILVNMHHIISDGWSLGVFLSELGQLYKAALDEVDPMLPVLEIQYSDYVTWQHSRVNSDELAKQQQYWQSRLINMPIESALPLHKPLTEDIGSAGEQVSGQFSSLQTHDIVDFAKQHNVSVNTLLLSAYLLFLHVEKGQKDVVIGTDIAGREQQPLEHLIGYFVKVLPIRSQYDEQVSFSDFMGSVQKELVNVLDSQLLALDDLVTLLNPQRRANVSPIVQQLFVMQNTPQGQWPVDELSLEPVPPFGTLYSKFNSAMFVTHNECLDINWIYNSHMYTQVGMTALLAQWQSLVMQLISGHDQPLVSQLSQLSSNKPTGARKSKKFKGLRAR